MNVLRFLAIVLCFCLSSSVLKAHNPSNINYTFDEGSQRLTIRLTTLAVVDLLKSNNLNLGAENAVDLNCFLPEIDDYFNETIQFSLNGKPLKFLLQNTKFDAHDSVLVFQFTRNASPWEKIVLNLSCFTEVYRKPTNFVTLKCKDHTQKFLLGSDLQEISFRTNEHNKATLTFLAIPSFGYLILFIFLLGACIYGVHTNRIAA